MNEVDAWLSRAAQITYQATEDPYRAIEARLAGERPPASYRARRDAWRTAAGVALVTLLSFAGSSWLARSMWGDEPLSPTWIAAPLPDSPFALLGGS